jgi:hypothetical protein
MRDSMRRSADGLELAAAGWRVGPRSHSTREVGQEANFPRAIPVYSRGYLEEQVRVRSGAAAVLGERVGAG